MKYFNILIRRRWIVSKRVQIDNINNIFMRFGISYLLWFFYFSNTCDDDIVNIDSYWFFRDQMQSIIPIVDIDNYWFFPYEAYVQ